jgi:hypothetical protein
MKRGRAPIAPVVACLGTLLFARGACVIDYVEMLLQGARVGFIDTDGRVVIEPQFERAQGFSEGRAAVRIDGKWGYTDVAGKLVVPARYTQAEPFSEGLAAVAALEVADLAAAQTIRMLSQAF